MFWGRTGKGLGRNRQKQEQSRSLRDDNKKDNSNYKCGPSRNADLRGQAREANGRQSRGMRTLQEGLDFLEVFFGVYAYGVVVGGFDVDVDVVF